MKILFVATPNTEGHHLNYFKELCKCNFEYALITERYCPQLTCKQYYDESLNFGTKSIIRYIQIINFIRKVCKLEKPDLVHIQCGDNFYRFFGFGLSSFYGCKVIITFHHMQRSFIRDISLKRIFKNIYRGIVHTSSLEKMIFNMKIKNVIHIEYPQFTTFNVIEKSEALDYFNINPKNKCLLAIGSTRYDKGLDILLKALQSVTCTFELLIAGSESDIKLSEIENLIRNYKSQVTIYLRYLTENELIIALSAADIVILPYRRIFDGASGPLGEGVLQKKIIIGPMHGSLGDIISENHLGYIFEAENPKSLSEAIQRALTIEWNPDKKYMDYRESLNLDDFLDKYKKLFVEAKMCENEV